MDTYNSRGVYDIPPSLLIARETFLTYCNKCEKDDPTWSHSNYYHMCTMCNDDKYSCTTSEKNISPITYIYKTLGLNKYQLTDRTIFLLDNIHNFEYFYTFVILRSKDIAGIMILFGNSTNVCRNCGIYANFLCYECKISNFCSKRCHTLYQNIHQYTCNI